MVLTGEHIVGVLATLTLMVAVGLYAGSKVKTAADFSTGGRQASTFIVSGTIMGTLVGGASTIGTAQLAFQYGFAAWWFTLGAGIACAILGLGMVRPMWESKVETLPQYLVKTYGTAMGPISSIFTSVGMYFSLIAQVLSFCALVTTMYPMDTTVAAFIGMLLVLAYVLFGGVWGTGLAGIVKLLLLYIAMVSCGVVAYMSVGGAEGLVSRFPPFPWFSLFGRGVTKDLASGFSLVVGVLSTQIYFQALLSARSTVDARKSALVSALLIPPIGIGGILVGLFMRANFPATVSSEVLPLFVLKFLPPVLGGVVLATLLISVVGTWAGVALGISTMVTKDLYQRFLRPQASGREALLLQRIVIVLLCLIALGFVSGNAGSLILSWSFMAMGLRGCTVLFPLIGAMFFPRLVTPAAGIASAFLGPVANVVWFLAFPKGIDPLYPGLLVSMATLFIGSLCTKKKALG